mmetsp:Transcript_56305/g.174569  ORF Transcript_56305/g.174569 Transcript_56305/m.174569 type:complete len:291 (-) Transcript_56305:569-1441(-)
MLVVVRGLEQGLLGLKPPCVQLASVEASASGPVPPAGSAGCTAASASLASRSTKDWLLEKRMTSLASSSTKEQLREKRRTVDGDSGLSLWLTSLGLKALGVCMHSVCGDGGPPKPGGCGVAAASAAAPAASHCTAGFPCTWESPGAATSRADAATGMAWRPDVSAVVNRGSAGRWPAPEHLRPPAAFLGEPGPALPEALPSKGMSSFWQTAAQATSILSRTMASMAVSTAGHMLCWLVGLAELMLRAMFLTQEERFRHCESSLVSEASEVLLPREARDAALRSRAPSGWP